MPEKQLDKLDFKAELNIKAELINDVLTQIIAQHHDIQPQLRLAIENTMNAPGKRIRAAITLWSCHIVSGSTNHAAEIAAAAIEMIHSYSLVHDDLPAMDDDDFRRGQPSCHKAFGEATAILTGDALLTLAFEILATSVDDPQIAIKLINTLAKAAGPAGMIAGQMADMQNEQAQGTVDILEYIHTNKTAKMFAAAAAMGAIAAKASDEQIKHLAEFGLKLGLGFQVADDLIDVLGTTEHLGKTAGKDSQQGKITYPAVVGIDESKRIAEELADRAVEQLDIFGPKADILRSLANAMLKRTR